MMSLADARQLTVGMGNGVWYRGNEAVRSIEIQIHSEDLGHPEKPDLLEIIDGDRPHSDGSIPGRSGKLLCLYCVNLRGRVEWMYLKMQPRPHLVHLNTSIEEHPPPPGISDKHKAFVEREVGALEREGFTTKVEVNIANRRRRPDFVTLNAPVATAGEVQVSYESPTYVARRTSDAAKAGLTSLWITDRIEIRNGPRAVVNRTTYQRVLAGTDMLIIAGLSGIENHYCGWDAKPCPVTRRRINCGRIHAYRAPAPGVHLDELVVGVAAGRWRLHAERTTKGAINCLWLPSDGFDRYIEDRHSDPAAIRARLTNPEQTRSIRRSHDRRGTGSHLAACARCGDSLIDVDGLGTHPTCDPLPPTCDPLPRGWAPDSRGWMAPRSVWGQPS